MEELRANTIAPRAPEEVVRLARMGSFHQSRLSFMRILLRRLKAENWRFETLRFEIDENGVGFAVYTAHGPERSYSLIAFAHDLPPEMRSDRVIATAWDATFTLFDGVPSAADIARLRGNVPKQEAGRVSERELSVSRANRSVRLWEHVVDRLAAGRQPSAEKVAEVGYLMRTTAVYGSGKLGAADREATQDRPEFAAPFQIEMLSVYLTRAFVMDLVEHIARKRAPETAVRLAPELRRRFGIGNSTGLGMAPFLINHPILLNNWIAAREEALARVRSKEQAGGEELEQLKGLVRRAEEQARLWRSEHPVQLRKLDELRADQKALAAYLESFNMDAPLPWNRLYEWAAQGLSFEGQEQLVSLLMELYPEDVDGLASCMAADESLGAGVDGAMSAARLAALCKEIYGWALDIDWAAPDAQARIWYVSQEKLEPRLGERAGEEDLEPYEQPLCPGRDVARMYADLRKAEGNVAAFLMAHPEHRHIARRVQIAARFPYAEIRDNTIAADMLPIDLLRAKLSFFGACHFDPRSDRWVRINMYRDAPFPHELASADPDGWTLPEVQM